MKCMRAQTRPRFIFSSERVLGGMEFEPMLTPRENPLYRKISPQEDRTCVTVDSEPNHYQQAIPAPAVTVERRVLETGSSEGGQLAALVYTRVAQHVLKFSFIKKI